MKILNLIKLMFFSFRTSKRKNPVFDENVIRIVAENSNFFRNPELPPYYSSI